MIDIREPAPHVMPDKIAKTHNMKAPDVLLPYQQRAIQACINGQHDVVFIEKSRRIGITWSIASEATLTASASGGQDVLYVGTSIDMAREFIETCASWARLFAGVVSKMGEITQETGEVLPKGWVFDDEKKDIQVLRIQFASGFKILAVTSKPRSLRGRQGWVIIDEGAFHDDLEEIMKAGLALLIWGGRVTVISTHDGASNPFNEYIKQIKAQRADYGHQKITFDQAISDGLYERIALISKKQYSKKNEKKWVQKIRDQYGEDGAAEELDCIPSQGSGTVFAVSTIEKAMKSKGEVLRVEKNNSFVDASDSARTAEVKAWLDKEVLPVLEQLSTKGAHYFGQDFARSGDLSILWIINKTQNIIRKTPLVLEMRNIPYQQQEQILFYTIDRLPNFIHGKLDATGNGGYLAERARQRYGKTRIDEVKLSNAWYEEHMPIFEADFKDGLSEIPSDLDLLNDHRAFKRVNGIVKVPRGERQKDSKDKTKKRHGDAGIAHSLAYIATVVNIHQPYKSHKVDKHSAGQSRLGSALRSGIRKIKGAY